MKDNSLETHKANSFCPICSTYPSTENIPDAKNLSFQQQLSNKHNGSTDIDNSFKNSIEESKDDKSSLSISHIDENSISELFKIYGKDNCLCNFLIFEENINFFSKFCDIEIKNITLDDYFESFIMAGLFGLNIPFISDNYLISNNIFNPTLSSMVLLIKSQKNNENKKFKESISVTNIDKNIKKIEFNEKNPYYHRDTIDSKLKEIHKIIGKKKIKLNDIINKGSFFSILWTPADTNNVVSSFLSFYTFDFKYIGTLIIKINEYKWLSCISLGTNYMNFKIEYLNKVQTILNYINNSYNEDIVCGKFFSSDYERYFYNL